MELKYFLEKNNVSILNIFLHILCIQNIIKTTRIVYLQPTNFHVCNEGPIKAKKVSFQGP